MNFDEVIKKTPSRLTVKERRAIGFIRAVTQSINLDFIDDETESRLEEIAIKMRAKEDENYYDGSQIGSFFTTLFAFFEISKSNVKNWALEARESRIELIADAISRTDPTPSRLKKYDLFDFDIENPADNKCEFWRQKMLDLRGDIGVMLAWRALAMTLDRAYGIPWICKVADFGDVYDALEKNNKEIFKISLFLNHGYADPEEIESLKWWQTAPTEALLWKPHNDEIDYYAETLGDIRRHYLVVTYQHYLQRGAAQCGY